MLGTTLKKIKRALLKRQRGDNDENAIGGLGSISKSESSGRKNSSELTPWAHRNRNTVNFSTYAPALANSNIASSSRSKITLEAQQNSSERISRKKSANTGIKNGPGAINNENSSSSSSSSLIGSYTRSTPNRLSILGNSGNLTQNKIPGYLAAYAAAAAVSPTVSEGGRRSTVTGAEYQKGSRNLINSSFSSQPAAARSSRIAESGDAEENAFPAEDHLSTDNVPIFGQVRRGSIGKSRRQSIATYTVSLPSPSAKPLRPRQAPALKSPPKLRPLSILAEEGLNLNILTAKSGTQSDNSYDDEDDKNLRPRVPEKSPKRSNPLTEEYKKLYGCVSTSSPTNSQISNVEKQDSMFSMWNEKGQDIYMVRTARNSSRAVVMHTTSHVPLSGALEKLTIEPSAASFAYTDSARPRSRGFGGDENETTLLEDFPWIDFNDGSNAFAGSSAADKSVVTIIRIPEGTPSTTVLQMRESERWDKLEKIIKRRQGVITLMPDLRQIYIDGGSERARRKLTRFVKRYLEEIATEKEPSASHRPDGTPKKSLKTAASSVNYSDDSYGSSPPTSPLEDSSFRQVTDSESVFVFYA